MLNEFRTRYPQGGLISELSHIDHGKYIVRVSVQIEGVILATGLAAADTVETAEDQARMRALALLNLGALPVTPTPITSIKEQNSKKPEMVTTQKTTVPKSKSEAKAKPPLPVEEVLEEAEPVWEPDEPELTLEPPQTYSYFPEPESEETPVIEEADTSFTLESSEIVIPPVESAKKTSSAVSSSEPTDYSEVIAKTNVEMKRLGWTNEQGRDYLIGTYGKRSRQLLEDEQLVEFLQYLEGLPTP